MVKDSEGREMGNPERWVSDKGDNLQICNKCKNFISDPKKFICAAYPDGIPREILTMEVDHHKPYKGDHGIRFEKRGD